MEIIYNNIKKAICFILAWVLLFSCFILDVSACENIDGAIEYIESNDILYKIEKHDNETIITNLIANEVTKIVQTGEFACFISLSNGEFHSIDLKDNYLYFDNEIKVAKIEKYVEEIQPFGMNGPWYYAYTIKCSSTYDKQGRDIVTNIIGYIPYLGVTSSVISLIVSAVGGNNQKEVYFKIDTYHDDSYRYLRDHITVYKNSDYTGSTGSYWTNARASV